VSKAYFSGCKNAKIGLPEKKKKTTTVELVIMVFWFPNF
jgi:hypothetical protein